MDFTTTYDDNTCVLSLDEKTKINNNCSGSGFIKQQRSVTADDHHPTVKSSRTDYFDQPNKSMSLRSDSLLSLSTTDANNMLSFSSSNSSSSASNTNNQTSVFSFYQPSHSYVRNTGYGYGGLQTDGWGGFHLGFAGGTDPEPGRCRRTDGKKWRCSRDAVPDQKYCERHINRGRHRSRKPVESQNGQAVSGPTASKVGPVVSSSSAPVSTPMATALGATFHQRNHNAQPLASSTQTPINRIQEPQALGINTFSVPKESNSVQESSVYPTNYGSFLDHGGSNPNQVPNFVDQWSKHEPLKPDWTQLSMSIPITASDFSSSSNSPAQEKLTGPPPGPTPEFDLDPAQKQASNWIPISWGNTNSMGGPLGEALKCKDPLLGPDTTEMWDAGNYHMGSGSSPTGVLQKSTFVSLSNSSSGSSPKKQEHGGGDQLLLSTLASIASL